MSFVSSYILYNNISKYESIKQSRRYVLEYHLRYPVCASAKAYLSPCNSRKSLTVLTLHSVDV